MTVNLIPFSIQLEIQNDCNLCNRKIKHLSRKEEIMQKQPVKAVKCLIWLTENDDAEMLRS